MKQHYSTEATKTMAAAAAFFQANKVSFLPTALKGATKEKRAA